MNQTNPFTSQPAAQARLNQSRSRLRLAVFAALGVCLLALVPVLGPGCKREEAPALPPVDTTNPSPLDGTNPSTLPPLELGHTNVMPLPPLGGFPPATNPVVAPVEVTPVAIPGTSSEHIVAAGESFYTIAKKTGTTIKAISDANPGVDSKKLKIGQKLNLPAPTASAPAAPGVAPVITSGDATYTVKSGDTITRIAKAHGTTIKAIKALNGLTTDRIKVGQKLKLPGKEAAAVAPATVVEPTPAVVPTVMPALPPMRPAR